MKHLPLAAAVLAFAALSAQAQTIERVKMTDNDLNCQQIYGEIGQMDRVVAMAAAQQPAAAAPAVAQADPAANVGGQVAGAVAQTALASAVAQNPGLLGNLGGFGGGLGSMFGGLAQQLAQGAAAQQAANSGVAQQQAASVQQSIALQAQQAQGRKEHLTGMFLSKGCKMSDIQK
ncbi:MULTISPECIES: hypothetical protein [unclassified Polaromonas]|uniref:hypothetical protein n=1 Tax=unclassified Polaromonas TaxID=2638319 RepID=UPI000F079A7B|nr:MULTISPECIES: hypothetical protein [unclassified Polaromonas]AYQ27698.1 hypothetical protein DT070_06455 [Polaromonas sp. SP1]QGJ17452.1 hypothetical protein F7R28_02970 [Polaromonas sp. Pch-P]